MPFHTEITLEQWVQSLKDHGKLPDGYDLRIERTDDIDLEDDEIIITRDGKDTPFRFQAGETYVLLHENVYDSRGKLHAVRHWGEGNYSPVGLVYWGNLLAELLP